MAGVQVLGAPAPLASPSDDRGSRCVAIFDLGSNSCRLMVVRVGPRNAACSVLNQVKQMVRLGEGVGTTGRLSQEAMDRTLYTLEGMADMCHVYGVQDVVACATAASRDAENGAEFLRLVHERTGIPFRIISGREEARLIYLGVASGMEYSEKKRLFIDIGGGSAELIVGSSRDCYSLDSVRTGCVRMSNEYLGDSRGPVSREKYRALQDAIRTISVHAVQRVRELDPLSAVGSSGTIQNLATMAAVMRGGTEAQQEEYARYLRYGDLRELARIACSCTLEERSRIPGINPRRGDVIVAGVAIIQTLMEELEFEDVVVSSRSLKDGILMDYLFRTRPDVFPQGIPTREQSVLRLGRQCRFEEAHARRVGILALDLLDSARLLGMGRPSTLERELLWYAALLHDVGIFISLENHHAHSWYLIRHKELLGFNKTEIEVMAAAAYFHRKGVPCAKGGPMGHVLDRLDGDQKKMVQSMALFLAVAECLDKSHCDLVRHARFHRARKDEKATLELVVAGDCPMELQALEGRHKLLRKICGTDVTIAVTSEAVQP